MGMMNDDMDSAMTLEDGPAKMAALKLAVDKLDPFALSFLNRCLENGMRGAQIKLAAEQASRVHPEVAEMLSPFTKIAIWGTLAGLGAKAAPAVARVAGWGTKAKNFAAPAVQSAKNFAGRPGVSQVYQGIRNPVAGALTGGAMGYGVDAVGSLTGLYDSNLAGYGAMLGGGMRMPGMRRLFGTTGPIAKMGPWGKNIAAGGRQTQRFFTGGGYAANPALGPAVQLGGKALARNGLGTAQKALVGAGVGLGPIAMGKTMGQEAFNTGLDDFAAQHGMTRDELGSMAQMLNSGDYLGLMQHGWGKLDPQTQMMIIGGLGLGGLGLAGAATGHGGMGAMAGLGGLGLLGAGLYQGGQRMGAFGGGGGQASSPIQALQGGTPPQPQQPAPQGGQVAYGSGPQMRNELQLQQGMA